MRLLPVQISESLWVQPILPITDIQWPNALIADYLAGDYEIVSEIREWVETLPTHILTAKGIEPLVIPHHHKILGVILWLEDV